MQQEFVREIRERVRIKDWIRKNGIEKENCRNPSKEEGMKYRKEYREKNKESVKKYNKEYREKNKKDR